MKMFGNSNNNGYNYNNGNKGGERSDSGYAYEEHKPKKSRARGCLLTFFIILVLTAGAVFLLYHFNVVPPEFFPKLPNNTDTGTGGETPTPPEPDGEATGEKYSFVILGSDDGNGNTDTIMIATFDTKDYKLDVVSIPRDTMVNVSWSVKKANTLLAYNGTDGIIESMADLIGFNVNAYIIVDLEAFKILIDEIGGVYYDVPIDMYYNDPAQDLYIDISAGPQTLTGDQALGVVRFRSGYNNADIGRIGTQQEFMKAAAQQIIEKKDSINLTTLISVFINHVDTGLTAGNLIWLAKEFYKVDSENINFHVLPGDYDDDVYGSSYVSIYVPEWLEMINSYINPLDRDIVESDLDILTRDDNGNLYSTSGVYAGNSSWGS